VNLSKAQFHDTNLEKVVFRDVKWGLAQTWLRKVLRGNSSILWDEIRPLEHERDFLDNAKTAENYRQLVLNYESKRDYESAEYFHIGEMEMRRKKRMRSPFYGDEVSSNLGNFFWQRCKLFQVANFWSLIRSYINSYGIYWLSSRYGSSYVQAIIVLLILILLFSFSFLFTGFQSTKEEQIRIIEYDFLQNPSHIPVSFNRFISDYGEAILYTLSIVTFQKDGFYQPLGWESKVMLCFAVILLAAQGAMVLFAIRRQFKR
jgi:hypothetical protein